MGPSPHLAWASPDCQPLGELPSGKGQDGEEQLRSPAERTSLNTAPPPPATQVCTLEMAPRFLLPVLHPGHPGEAPDPMAQAWCCLSCWRGMPGGDLSTIAHPQYLMIIIRAPKSDSRLHTQMLVLSCFMVLPVPPLPHQNKDQQGQQIRLRITERCKAWIVFFPPTSFLPPWVRYWEPEVLFGWVIVTGMLQLFGGWNAGSI